MGVGGGRGCGCGGGGGVGRGGSRELGWGVWGWEVLEEDLELKYGVGVNNGGWRVEVGG